MTLKIIKIEEGKYFIRQYYFFGLIPGRCINLDEPFGYKWLHNKNGMKFCIGNLEECKSVISLFKQKVVETIKI